MSADHTARSLEAPAASEAARLLTAAQVAERWQVTVARVYRLAREGAVPVVRLGERCVRFRIEAVQRFEQAGGTGAADA